jgi:hypothetical protein
VSANSEAVTRAFDPPELSARTPRFGIPKQRKVAMRILLLSLITLLGACSIPSNEPARKQAKKAAAPLVKPKDESRRFPLKDRVKIEIVDNHILGKDFMPGGNLAEYKRGGTTYQQFLVETESPQVAALLLYEYKGVLPDAKYLAHMGAYFGKDGDQPVLVFQKDKWLAGIVGLPQKDADLVARDFAARLY